MMDRNIVNDAKEHVLQQLDTKLPKELVYHSAHHTIDVVASANEISTEQNISEEEREILNIAAWFHDIGYTKGVEHHEKESAKMAIEFLEANKYPKERIEKVVNCILATQMPQSPTNQLERIMCDADLMHLASEDYFNKSDLLHKEIEQTRVCKISEDQWLEMNKDFLDSHCFFTDYAKKKYESSVKDNLRKVQERLRKWKK